MSELGSSPTILSKQTAEYKAGANTQNKTYNPDEKGRHGRSLKRKSGPGDWRKSCPLVLALLFLLTLHISPLLGKGYNDLIRSECRIMVLL